MNMAANRKVRTDLDIALRDLPRAWWRQCSGGPGEAAVARPHQRLFGVASQT
jgi:hypothetical protein